MNEKREDQGKAEPLASKRETDPVAMQLGRSPGGTITRPALPTSLSPQHEEVRIQLSSMRGELEVARDAWAMSSSETRRRLATYRKLLLQWRLELDLELERTVAPPEEK